MPITIVNTGEFYLYRHIRLDRNEVFYVGIGKKSKRRDGYGQEFSRAFEASNRKKHWKNITSNSPYRVEIILESDSHESIKEKEKEFIKLYGRRDLGTGTLTNYTDGGDGVSSRLVSVETRKKISDGHKGKVYTEERKRLCAGGIRVRTEETKKKMSLAQVRRQQKLRECQSL